MRFTSDQTTIQILEHETVCGLKIWKEIKVSGFEINFDMPGFAIDIVGSLPDASGTFTGFYDKDSTSGKDSDGSSGAGLLGGGRAQGVGDSPPEAGPRGDVVQH
jgi:hypothetical protein